MRETTISVLVNKVPCRRYIFTLWFCIVYFEGIFYLIVTEKAFVLIVIVWFERMKMKMRMRVFDGDEYNAFKAVTECFYELMN